MMKKLFTLLFLLFFVVACVQEQETIMNPVVQEQTVPGSNVPDTIVEELSEESMEATVAEPHPVSISSEEVSVNIQGFAFSPTEVKVTKGTTVTWTNQDSVKHNVAFDSGAVTGPLLAKGESYSYTFDETGTFAYHCNPHPNMKARVIVE